MPSRPDYTAAGITAGAAMVGGFFLLSRSLDERVLAWVAVGAGAVALLLIVLAGNPGGTSRAQWLLGPNGIAAHVARPLAWLAGILALLVVAVLLLPGLGIEWLTKDNVLAVGLVGFLLLAVLGWGPAVTRVWPSGLRLSTLTVVGSLVAIALIAVYLYFLVGMREQATATGMTDARWTRLVELRSTLEALAFAAAGALLGQTVGRQLGSQQGEQKAQEAGTTAKETVTRALDALTATDTTADEVDVENAQGLAMPSNREAAIKEARKILAQGRESIDSTLRGNPSLSDF